MTTGATARWNEEGARTSATSGDNRSRPVLHDRECDDTPTSEREAIGSDPAVVRHDIAVNELIAAGLGLDYDTIRLDRTTEDWLIAGCELRNRVAETLDGLAAGVEQIGSSSVLGLLAKPIVDLAVGLSTDRDLDAVTKELEEAGWIYRGDAGDSGGHVFVLRGPAMASSRSPPRRRPRRTAVAELPAAPRPSSDKSRRPSPIRGREAPAGRRARRRSAGLHRREVLGSELVAPVRLVTGRPLASRRTA